MARMFFALWPDAGTRDRLARVGRRAGIDEDRLVPHRNLHITLAFLGNVGATAQEALQEGAGDVSAGRFTLDITRSGWWRRSGPAWVGPARVPRELKRLHSELSSLAYACGLAVDSRPYRPHVTLARKLKAMPRVEFEPIRWEVREFCLVESRTLPEGPEYRIIRRWPLT